MEKLLFSISGPSSSGKSEVLQQLQDWIQSLGLTVKIRGSVSRNTFTDQTTLEDRKDPKVQMQMLKEAVELETSLINDNETQVILADRTILDGYVYFKEYATGSEAEYEYYHDEVTRMLGNYSKSFCLSPVVFKEDSIRKEFDKNFAEKFISDFQSNWPEMLKSQLFCIEPIYGIDNIVDKIKAICIDDISNFQSKSKKRVVKC